MERYSQSQVKTCIPIPALVARAVLPHAFTARERKNQTWWRATSAADRWSTVDGDGDVAETQSTLPRDNKKEGRARMGQLMCCTCGAAFPGGRIRTRRPARLADSMGLSSFRLFFFFSPPGAAPARHASPEGPVMSSASAASTGSGSGSSWRIVFEPTLDICI